MTVQTEAGHPQHKHSLSLIAEEMMCDELGKVCFIYEWGHPTLQWYVVITACLMLRESLITIQIVFCSEVYLWKHIRKSL